MNNIILITNQSCKISIIDAKTVIFILFILDLSHKKIFTNPATSQQKECSFASFPRHVWNSVVNSLKAWLSYMKHPARDAGLGLAFLYMTVLGFDNITYGYCLRQCVTESILGGLVAGSAIFGVSGSLSFPVLRRKIGLNKTGLIGMASLVATLSMCVISIWVDGSPFDVDYFKGSLRPGVNFINILLSPFSTKGLCAVFLDLYFGSVIFWKRISVQKLLVKC